MRLLSLILIIMTTTSVFGQWPGDYYGTVNGDNVRLTLSQNGTAIQGEMQDSQQTYFVQGSVNGMDFSGTATEGTYGISFGLKAHQNKDMLECILVVDMNGEHAEVPFLLQKQGSVSGGSAAPSGKIPFPAGATFPAALSGNWTQQETYNSGYGDNFMGANFSQSMTFHPDGTLSEGASNASMSGANYSGQSSGAGSGKLDGLGWYALQNNFYLIVFHEGKWVPVHVGTWYTENNHLLITGNNGEKLLLSR
jgi:hypothetical protein